MPLNGPTIIWVVDDSATDGERVAKALRGDYEVVVFQDGAVALERLASSVEKPDLLLLDWVMPGITGVEICTYVRASKATAICRIPVILLTSRYGSDEIVEAFRSGANDYLVKPFVDEELKARVRTLTSSKRHVERAEALVRDLKRSEERLSLATSSAGLGIWEWDVRQGAVTSTNIHRKIFDLPTAGPIVFRDIFEKIIVDDREEVQAALASAMETKSDYSSEFRIAKSDGSIAWIMGHGRAIYDEEGNPLRMVGIHLDISSRKQSEEELKRAKEEAERANHMKSAFLANMSHEIRTPLGAMLGFAHLMQDPTITEMELSNYLQVLTRNGEQLSIIINDILDLSKVEAGRLSYEHHEFDPAEIGRDVVSLFAANAQEKRLSLEFEEDPSTPNSVTTDPTRLRQIVANLVNNAIKFTKSGGVRIRSFGTTASDGKKQVGFEVVDTGMGVTAEHAERIFEMFVQADDSMTRKYGGTGIGLALSRQLARELGGDLRLTRSQPGVGSTFCATVTDHPEKARGKVQIHAPPPLEQKPISLDGIRVLVVDDAPDNQQLLTRYLSKRGAKVETASNGIDGYQEALRHPYDVVLMDLQMPVMDGYTATRRLRTEGYKRPIIALTAHAMSEVSAKCLEAGCDGYLPKPINPQQLIETIAEHSRVRRPVLQQSL